MRSMYNKKRRGFHTIIAVERQPLYMISLGSNYFMFHGIDYDTFDLVLHEQSLFDALLAPGEPNGPSVHRPQGRIADSTSPLNTLRRSAEGLGHWLNVLLNLRL